MVYRRRTNKRRTTVRTARRRIGRRPLRSARPSRALTNYRKSNIHSYKRSFTYAYGASTSSFDGSYYLGATFAINQLPAVGEFSALYDMYRINGIKFSFMYRSTALSAMETNNQPGHIGMPYMYYVIDRDDNSTPTAVVELQEYAKSKRFDFDTGRRVCNIYWKPNVCDVVHNTSGTTARSQVFNRWIDFASVAVEHFGLKLAFQQPITAGVGVPQSYFDIMVTYYFQCRDVR